MPNDDGANKTSPDDLLTIRRHLPDFTRLDGTINIRGLSKAVGGHRTTVDRRVKMIREEDLKAAQEAYTPDIDGIPETKPRVRVRAYNVSVTRDLPVRRVVVIGDLHMKPGMDFEHMRWIGRYVSEAKPDNVVQIGDAFDMSSCEFHSPPGSASQLHRPSFSEDIASGEEAFDTYHSEIGIGEIPHDVTLGNHEFRVWRLEELAPNLAGTLTLQLEQFFYRYRWRVTPYRQWLFMEGVGFTHVPMSIMQKPIGGRYPENTIGNQATHSIIFGHTHRNNSVTVPKIGINNSITITNVGSAMPHGYIPPYANGATTGYTYGIHDLRLRGGRVEGGNFISLLELEERFA